MIKHVTGDTTLGELAVLRGALGVREMKISFERACVESEMLAPLSTICVTVITGDVVVIGRGETEAIAIDDAMSRLVHKIGAGMLSGKSCVEHGHNYVTDCAACEATWKETQ